MRIVSRKYGVIRTRQQSLRDTPWRGSCVRRQHKTAYRKLGPVTGHGLSGITGVATKAISEINFHSFEPLAKLQFDLESEAHGL